MWLYIILQVIFLLSKQRYIKLCGNMLNKNQYLWQQSLHPKCLHFLYGTPLVPLIKYFSLEKEEEKKT